MGTEGLIRVGEKVIVGIAVFHGYDYDNGYD
jgi:hypothetical protein